MNRLASLSRQFEDRFPELFRREDMNLLRSYAIISLGLTSLHLAFKVWLQAPANAAEPLYLPSTLFTIAAMIAAIVLFNRNRIQLGGLLLIATVIILIAIPAVLDGRGLRTPIFLLYVIPILVADFILGTRAGLVLTVLGVIATWVTFYLELTGIFPGLKFVAGPPLFNHALFYTIAFSYVHLFARSYIRRNQKVVEEVELSQRRLLDSEKQRIAEQQSRILMSEMHDGIGGALVTLKMMLGSQQTDNKVLEGMVDRCLADLRLTILAVDPDQPSLGTLLAVMRADYNRICEARNIRLLWQIDDALMEPEVPVATRLHMLRVTQEAITNALKHAAASTIEMRATVVDGRYIDIVVRDDGVAAGAPDSPASLAAGSGIAETGGGDASPPPSSKPVSNTGYGLRNMQLRASQGQFTVRSGRREGGAGFQVSLHWPAESTDPGKSPQSFPQSGTSAL